MKTLLIWASELKSHQRPSFHIIVYDGRQSQVFHRSFTVDRSLVLPYDRSIATCLGITEPTLPLSQLKFQRKSSPGCSQCYLYSASTAQSEFSTLNAKKTGTIPANCILKLTWRLTCGSICRSFQFSTQ